jgi:hypothetical protein
MKPRRTLLVGINKKVEWGILSVADIAVNREIFRLHRPSGPRGTELAACDALAKALDLPLALEPGCRLSGRPGRRRRLRRLSAPIGLTRSFWISSLPLHVRLPRDGWGSQRAAHFCRFCRSSQ